MFSNMKKSEFWLGNKFGEGLTCLLRDSYLKKKLGLDQWARSPKIFSRWWSKVAKKWWNKLQLQKLQNKKKIKNVLGSDMFVLVDLSSANWVGWIGWVAPTGVSQGCKWAKWALPYFSLQIKKNNEIKCLFFSIFSLKSTEYHWLEWVLTEKSHKRRQYRDNDVEHDQNNKKWQNLLFLLHFEGAFLFFVQDSC